MKIIGKGKPIRDDQNVVIDEVILVSMTVTEARKITGVDGRPIIAGRFKPGREVNISAVYSKVQEINTKETELRAAMQSIRSAADNIENSLNLGN